MTVPQDTLLTLAVEAVTCGGHHALKHVARRKEAVETFAHDIKLKLDVECQQKIETLILARFPEHRFLGEEDDTVMDGISPGAQREEPARHPDTYEWIVDPIDGTVNFSNGLPVWCSSVAVRRQGRVLAGAVYAPMLDALYAATADGPATRNGTPIQVSSCKALRNAIVMTGMDKNVRPGVAPYTIFESLASSCRKARIVGSAAVDLCWVAEGAADGYFEGSIYLWDIAAAGLIVERAGGRIEILAEREEPNQLSVAASNGILHDELKQVVTSA